MNNIVFFMIKTRSGTQWLHNLFSVMEKAHSDEHPPCPGPESKFFRKTNWLPDEGETQHNTIKVVSREKTYIQSSNIGYWMIPYFLDKWKGGPLYDKVKLVHVVRDPINNSLSLLRMGANHFVHNSGPNHINADSIFSNKEFKENWKSYSRFERAIVYWYEFHIFMEEIKQKHPTIPALSINFEEMMTPDGAKKVLEFCGLPAPEDALQKVYVNKDKNRHKQLLVKLPDIKEFNNFPAIIELAEKYGYTFDIDDIYLQKLTQKYIVT